MSGYSAVASRLDLSGPRPANVWREGGAVWISCSGCTRHLRLIDLPSGTIACPDCHETMQYNLAGKDIPEMEDIQMPGKKWTEEDYEILRRMYPRSSREEIMDALGGQFTWVAIYSQASLLHLPRDRSLAKNGCKKQTAKPATTRLENPAQCSTGSYPLKPIKETGQVKTLGDYISERKIARAVARVSAAVEHLDDQEIEQLVLPLARELVKERRAINA